eukprot:s116_g13.t1
MIPLSIGKTNSGGSRFALRRPLDLNVPLQPQQAWHLEMGQQPSNPRQRHQLQQRSKLAQQQPPAQHSWMTLQPSTCRGLRTARPALEDGSAAAACPALIEDSAAARPALADGCRSRIGIS